MMEKDQADSVQGTRITPRSHAVGRRLSGVCCKCPWGTVRQSMRGVALILYKYSLHIRGNYSDISILRRAEDNFVKKSSR